MRCNAGNRKAVSDVLAGFFVFMAFLQNDVFITKVFKLVATEYIR